MIPLNDLHPKGADRDRVLAALAAVAESGVYVHGPQHHAFEEEFAAYLGVEHVVGCASGTDALEIALRAVGVGRGSSVGTVANAGGYATSAIRRIGALPVYVDVDEQTANIDPAVIPWDVDALIATHLYGRMADLDRIGAFCATHGIRIVEDCAQAAGATADGLRAGAFGDAAAFSFYPTKNLACLGDGGAVATRLPDVGQAARLARQYGWTSRYEVTAPGGFNSRLDELQAAVLRTRLAGLDVRNERRRRIAARYADALPGAAGRLLRGGGDFVAHLAVVVTPERQALRERLNAAGVATSVHYPIPDHLQACEPFPRPVLPVTERLAGQVLTVPCYPGMPDAWVDRVCDALAAS